MSCESGCSNRVLFIEMRKQRGIGRGELSRGRRASDVPGVAREIDLRIGHLNQTHIAVTDRHARDGTREKVFRQSEAVGGSPVNSWQLIRRLEPIRVKIFRTSS